MSGAGEETVAKLLELGEHPDTADDVCIVSLMSASQSDFILVSWMSVYSLGCQCSQFDVS